MLNISKLLLKIIAIQSLMLLQSCGSLVVPIEYIYKAGEGEKDVSADFKRGHVVGKEYELLEDAFLTQLCGCNQVSLNQSCGNSYTYDKNGSKIELETYSICETIPKGTKFRVCGVLVQTFFGSEAHVQYILANLIDEQKNPIPTRDFSGNIVPIRVTYLFKDTFQEPEQNWIFTPKPRLIKEITD